MKENKFVSVITYVYNNETIIDEYLNLLLDYFSNKFKEVEFIFVDDCSDDCSIEKIKSYVKRNKNNCPVNIVKMGYHQGIETCINAGRNYAIGDVVYEFDSMYIDYDKEILDNMFEEFVSGNDIVSASSGNNTFFSKLFYRIFNFFSITSNKIEHETFRIISRRAINRVDSVNKYISYRKAAYVNSGLSYKVVKYNSKKNVKKQDDYKERTRLALDSLIYYTNFLDKISEFICALLLVITLVVIAYIIKNIIFDKTIEGWVSTMGFLSIGFFGIFLILTIILKYLSLLVELNYKKKHFIVKDVEKIN